MYRYIRRMDGSVRPVRGWGSSRGIGESTRSGS